MINRFRNFSVLNILLLLLVAFLMRISVWVGPVSKVGFSVFEPFAKLMIKADFLNHISYGVGAFLATVVILIQAFFLNYIINHHLLFGRSTLVPALSYVLLSSVFPQFLVLSAPLLANFFLIWMFAKIVRISRAGNPLSMMFDMGFIVAVGTFVYFPFIAMFLIVLLGLLLFRPFYWREWFAAILGFVAVYVFVAMFYYWNNDFGMFLQIFRPFANKFPNTIPLQPNDYLPLIPLVILLVGGFWLLRQNFYNNFVAARKTYQWLFYTFLVAMISLYLKPGFSMSHFILAIPSLAVFVAYYFNFAKIRWLYESLFWLFVLSIQYFHYV